MDKKQQAEKEARRHEERVRMALAWSQEVPAPDVPPPTKIGELTTGWLYNDYSYRVDVACSSAVGHARGQTEGTTTQGRRSLYSTRKRALQALRAAMERRFAEELAKIDVLLAGEKDTL